MLMPKRKKIRVWNKGQVTIPKNIRENLDISDDTILNMVQIGSVIFMTKRELLFPKIAKEFRAVMKESNLTEADLLKELKETRTRLFKEEYGDK